MTHRPITIESQASFFVGGHQVTAAGLFDPSASPEPDSTGQTYWVDQMYVQYQVPSHSSKLPLILVHGGGGTGRVWETTPDGREGYQTIFLRRGHPVYIVDTPRGGRSGFPSFDGEFGTLDEQHRLVSNRTKRPGREKIWSRWRLGPKYPEVFPVQAFPVDAVDHFLQHVRPMVSDDAEVTCSALMALIDRIGPAVLVTHSNSGLPGWLAGCRSSEVRAIISYEPGFVFPADDMPPACELDSGAQRSCAPVTQQEFSALAKIPIQVVYGDNIPSEPVPDLVADNRRAQVLICNLFIEALRRRGGNAAALHLPDVGLKGNSHFMFSDLNNVQVADQLSAFLTRHHLV
jgi:pimeloyl-ACP methyl ester carboxylesterase